MSAPPVTRNVAPLAQERAFGRSVGAVLVLIGSYQLYRGRSAAMVTLPLGIALALAGTFAPALLRVPSRWWWRLSHALGWVNSRVLLSLFFFGVLTPVGLFFRSIGRDPLQRRKRATTWSAYGERPPNHYEHLF
jgi:saxitoxin biosynthesis operon SxtJ-like protein